MVSRYDIMLSSLTEADSVDKQVYPDPLSVNYNLFQYTQPPYIVDIDDRIINFPYITTNAFYGTAEYDDIVFNINGVPHVSLLDLFKTYYTWSATAKYSKNETITYSGLVYSSAIDNNYNNIPIPGGPYWSVIEAQAAFGVLRFPVYGDITAFMKEQH
jgi:hypothetical protein